jgi:DNA-binding NarL/FixJ family response regulator
MESVTVGLVSNDQFFREGLKALLGEGGYTVTGSVSDHRELTAVVPAEKTPVLVLVDFPRDVDAASDQMHYLTNNLPGVTVVGFSDENDSDWLALCEDYEIGALLRKQVSFKALLHCLELVMMGERVLPTGFDRTPRKQCDEASCGCSHEHDATDRNRPRGQSIPCMTCGRPFETEDRRSNRICSNCKTRMSRVSSVMEHTLHY